MSGSFSKLKEGKGMSAFPLTKTISLDSGMASDKAIDKADKGIVNLSARPFFDKWSLYFHLSNDSEWNISSYKIIMQNIDNPIPLIELKRNINETIVMKSMLFIMRNNIAPMWEDPQNKNGGCFSFKIASSVVHSVWWDFVFLLCGETLMKDANNMKKVNGLTISPKYEHSIIKIWLSDLTLQSFDILNLVSVRELDSQKPLFKKHGSDK
jgi:hypothetical protein